VIAYFVPDASRTGMQCQPYGSASVFRELDEMIAAASVPNASFQFLSY